MITGGITFVNTKTPIYTPLGYHLISTKAIFPTGLSPLADSNHRIVMIIVIDITIKIVVVVITTNSNSNINQP